MKKYKHKTSGDEVEFIEEKDGKVWYKTCASDVLFWSWKLYFYGDHEEINLVPYADGSNVESGELECQELPREIEKEEKVSTDPVRVSDTTDSDSDGEKSKNQAETPKETEKEEKISTSSVRGSDSNKPAEFDFRYVAEDAEFKVYRDGEFVSKIKCHTVAGRDGKNAYEEWAERQPKGADASLSAWYKIFQGENGKDAAEWSINDRGNWCRDGVETSHKAIGEQGKSGKDAYEVWLERNPTGTRDEYEESLSGPAGDNAYEVWKKLDPSRSSAKEADFFRWLADQVEKRVQPKDGDTFMPRFDDGELVFVNKYGEEVTERVPYRAKSNFEVWKEMPENENKTKEDFFESLRGEPGIVLEANHSYKDIKDCHCPVQKIDTELLVSLEDSRMNPDAVIRNQLQEIANIRAEGAAVWNDRNRRRCKGLKKTRKQWKEDSFSKESALASSTLDESEIIPQKELKRRYWMFNGRWIFKHWGGLFKEFCWWCAGVDKPLLRMCPSDHSKYMGMGTVILFTGLMAFFSCSIAMQLVFSDNPEIKLLVAAFWALMIFFLDRFITNTMYSDGKPTISGKEFLSGLPRILIAIFLGIVISAPLELKIFDNEIKGYIVNNEIEKNPEYIAAKKNYDSRLKDIEDDLQFVRNSEPNRDDFKKVQSYTAGVETMSCIDSITGDTNTSTNLVSGLALVEDPEAYGKAVDRYWKMIDTLAAKSDTLRKKLVADFINTKNKIIDTLNTKYDSAKLGGLHDRLSAMHEIAMRDFKPLFSAYKDTARIRRYVDSCYSVMSDSGIVEKDSSTKEALAQRPLDTANDDTLQQKPLPNTMSNIVMEEVSLKDLQKHTTQDTVKVDTTAMALVDTSQQSEKKQDSALMKAQEPVAKSDIKLSFALSRGPDYIVKTVLSIISTVLLCLLFIGKRKEGEENNVNNSNGVPSQSSQHCWIKGRAFWLRALPAALFGCIIGCSYNAIYYILYYLFATPIGLIMLLFILIDVSPVLYKMMLTDGVYDNYLNQEKELRLQKIRLNASRMKKGIEKSKLKDLSSFIIGDMYKSMAPANDVKDDKSKESQNEQVSDTDKDTEATRPHKPKSLDEQITDENEKIFNTVLGLKKRIILDSYQSWYRDMRATMGRSNKEEKKD